MLTPANRRATRGKLLRRRVPITDLHTRDRETDALRVDEELRAREARVRAILNHTADAIITIDEGRIDSFNRAAERIFGYPADEVIGKDIWSLMTTPDVSSGSSSSDVPDRNSGFACEVLGRRRDGSTFPLELSLSEVVVGERCLVTALLRDISERKRNEADRQAAAEALREAKEAAERANSAKTDFLANMSHEIRTPLNAVIGIADLLGEARLDAEHRRYVDVLKRAGSNLLALVNDILDLAKIEAHRLDLETIPFNLRDLVSQAVEAVAFGAQEKGLSLSVQVMPDVPQGLVGDPARVRQILMNLLGNAVKFTKNGEVTLAVQAHAAAGGTGALLFSVSDTGIGIPAEKLEAVFERFSQVDSSTTRVHGGTGLGLAICRSLVSLMGGRIWAERRPGGGTTIRFTARFGLVSQVESSRSFTPGRHLTPRPTVPRLTVLPPIPREEPGPVAPRRILLVEDHPDNRAVVLAYLKSSPHHVVVAENGAAAVEIAQGGDVDLILMDMQMPVMDGYEATRRIRAWERQHGLRPTSIIAFTAHAMKEESERARAAGCDGHLAKPVRKQALLQAIADYTAEWQRQEVVWRSEPSHR